MEMNKNTCEKLLKLIQNQHIQLSQTELNHQRKQLYNFLMTLHCYFLYSSIIDLQVRLEFPYSHN